MVFHWSLSDSKSPHVSRTLLSILTDLNNAVVWIVSTRPFISNSFTSPFINPLVTVTRSSIIIIIIIIIIIRLLLLLLLLIIIIIIIIITK